MMRKGLKAGACGLALCIAASSVAEARTAGCATLQEVAALKASAVQQELMDAALGCEAAQVQEFNRFQTIFGAELRKSDALMLRMFKRISGNVKGDAQYNAFKTRAASNAELRRIGARADFCKTADFIFNAALSPIKPLLLDFAAGVAVEEAIPVEPCPVHVAANLRGAISTIVPTPRPALPGDPPSP